MSKELNTLAKNGEFEKIKKLVSENKFSKEQLVEAAYQAVENDHYQLSEWFLSFPLNVDDLPLGPHKAASIGSKKLLDLYIRFGADLSIESPDEPYTVADCAIKSGHDELQAYCIKMVDFSKACRYVQRGEFENLDQLLSKNQNISNIKVGKHERNLAHIATDWPGNRPNSGETIRILAKHGTDLNNRLKEFSTETPLHFAVSTDDHEATAALIDCGADIDAKGAVIGGGTPLFNAVVFKKFKAAKVLIDKGARFNIWLIAGLGDFERVKQFFDSNGNFDIELGAIMGDDGEKDPEKLITFAFLFACSNGHLEIAKWLYEKNPDINIVSPVGTTPLDDAIKGNHKETENWLKSLGAKSANELART